MTSTRATLNSADPLLADWHTLHGLPPYADIRAAHFSPALHEAMRVHRGELDALAAQPHAATFDNTVAAFDRCGRLLSRVAAVFHNLAAVQSSPELQAVQREMAAPLAAHSSAVYMHAALFKRIDALAASGDAQALSVEQQRLLQRVHLDFVRAGARLAPAAQARCALIMQQLAELTTRFAHNVLHDESRFQLLLRDAADLAGLPDFLRDAARQAAADRGLADGHVITLSRSLIVPFLTFSRRRELREQAWRAWVQRGEHTGDHDNRQVARQILELRAEQAELHGYGCYADYVLADTMAGSTAAVHGLLDEVWPRALQALQREREALDQVRVAAGDAGPIEDWDWRYWAEQVRQQRYALDDGEIKPYFALQRVQQAAFDCAGRLFGLRFTELTGARLYHADVKAYEVHDADAQLRAIFVRDNFARPDKRSGAWMSSLRVQHRNPADGQVPVILNHTNFAKAGGDAPTLLSLDDARTLFHEFGHALHGMLSDVTYETLSGTNVLRDFVELPSQLFEHWLGEQQVLEQHARHWRDDAAMPAELLRRIEAARLFNQAYETVRYCASAYVDMAAHSLPRAALRADLCAFEAQTLQRLGLPHGVGMNHRLVNFQHLFAGSGYAAGYYVYLWAEVLDADAYAAFTEAGDPFDAGLAERLRRCIYASGNSLEPLAAFTAFRGRAPRVQALLQQRGLLAPPG